MFNNYKTAFKAGLLSWLASSLVIAVLLLPYLSNLADFGHFHGPNTTEHVHSLQYFIQTSLAVQGFLLAVGLGFICSLLISYSSLVIAFIFNHKKSRAPPYLFKPVVNK